MRPGTRDQRMGTRLLALARKAGLLAGIVLALASAAAVEPAAALQPIAVGPDDQRIEITALGELYESRGDTLQVETAVGADGAVGRMAVRAATPGTNPNWLVFALNNSTDKPIERWLTAERYSLIGSGAVWPDLDAKRIEAVTPSYGFVPERIDSDRADVFRVTLEPGQTITYVVELSSERFVRVYLWKPLDYELKARDRQLFNGILLGVTGLLAVFLTSIFAANHKLVFPAAALVAWCALAYLCVDFGFFHKLFHMKPQDNAAYRAVTEAALAASLVVFLHIFLRLGLWHGLIRMLISVWILVQLALIAIAVIDPRLASTFARLSFVAIGGIGGAFTIYLAARGQERALSLIPIWMLFLVWIFSGAMVLTGRLSGDMVVSSLVAGMVLILLLIGYVVTQYAFRSIEPVYGGAPSELQVRSVAVESAGAAVWEWSNRRDEIKVGSEVEATLGLMQGELTAKADEFITHLHPADREKFRLLLWSVQERTEGRLRADFRMRHADNSYRWFEVEAARVPGSDPRWLRCVGLMRDVTDQRRAHERLVQNAVHCSLTGLPNRELLLDRLAIVMERAKAEPRVRPQLLSIGLDKFKTANAAFGPVVGDSLLLTVARRLQRHLGPQDTLARIDGDYFAILLPVEQGPQELAALAERIRRSLRSPVKIAGQEVVITGSIGIAAFTGQEAGAADLLKDAEIAMYRAKRSGADRVEVFKPEMRADREERAAIEVDIRRALEKSQVRVLYLPIVYLPTEELAGFEAIVRWEHPKHGMINPLAFEPIGEHSDFTVKIGAYALTRAVRDAASWQSLLPRGDTPLFVSINLSNKEFFRPELVQEVRHILGRNIVPKGVLRLEISERLVMENPEQACDVMEWLESGGAALTLDGFGGGYSSFAHLHRLSFDAIKLDRDLVRQGGASDATGTSIVRSAVALAHELGKKVFVEGVETSEDSASLRAAGCEYAQGLYFAGAQSDADVAHLLKAIRKSERKLQPRGMFKAKSKKKPPPRKARVAGEKAADQVPSPPPEAVETGAGPPPEAREAAAQVQNRNDAPERSDGIVVPLPRGIVRRPPRPAQDAPHGANGGTAMGGPPPPPDVTPGLHGLEPLPHNPLMAGAPPVNESFAPPMSSGGPPPLPSAAAQELMRPPPPPGSEPFDLPAETTAPPIAPPPLPPAAVPDRPPLAAGHTMQPPFVDAGPPPVHPVDTDPLPRFIGSEVTREPKPVPMPRRRAATPPPDFSALPPSIAASLARLAGVEPEGVVPPSQGPRPRSKAETERD